MKKGATSILEERRISKKRGKGKRTKEKGGRNLKGNKS